MRSMQQSSSIIETSSSRRLDRVAFNVNDFSIQYDHVKALSAEDLLRTSWLTERWLYNYYKNNSNNDDDSSNKLPGFFILVTSDGQNATETANILSFDAYLSFWSEENSTTEDPMEIIAAPFFDLEANAMYARSLKLDMASFQNVSLTVDPPMTNAIDHDNNNDSLLEPTFPAASSRPIEENNNGGMSMWGKALGGTAIGIIAILHMGVFALLLMRAAKRWGLSRNDVYEEYCSSRNSDDGDDDEEALSILATPSKSPTYDASGAVFLGTIHEDDSFHEAVVTPSSEGPKDEPHSGTMA